MVNFEDDFFAPMVQDESRKKSSGSRSAPKSSSSSRSRVSKGSSSRLARGSSRELDQKRGDGPKREESKRDSHRSSRRSGGSRESVGRTDSGSSAETDYGYGDPAPAQDLDYGYGDPEPAEPAAPPPTRSRRQRRCSIADVMNVPEGSEEPAAPAVNASVARTKSMERNIAIPMAADEPRKPQRARRASLMGAMGAMGFAGENKKEQESKEQKKPGQDRDRRRQGTLMDRVGAGDRDRGSRGGGTSYSSRVLSK